MKKRTAMMDHGLQLRLLAISTMTSFTAAVYVVAVLEPEDRINVYRGGLLTSLGFVFFPSMFAWLNVLGLRSKTGHQWRLKYDLTASKVLDINNKIVSAVQAVLCALSGAIVCSYSCFRDVTSTSHYMSVAYAWFGAAYFFYDIWSMYKIFKCACSEKSPRVTPTLARFFAQDGLMLAHHVFIGGYGFLVIVYLRKNLGDCMFGFPYLMELSTPFVSIRGILSLMKLKQTTLYRINGMLMLVTFGVCRVVSLPFALWLYSRAVNMGYIETWLFLPTGCKISIALLLLPQLYWFYLIVNGAVKVFLLNDPKPSEGVVKKSS